MKNDKIVIIGGGASGMVAAISAKRTNPNAEVIIMDRMKSLGKKLLATGNGKGNFSNVKASPRFYNDPEYVEKIFSQVSLFDTIRFFDELGIFPKNDAEGRMYPFSDMASSIHGCLTTEIERLKIEVQFETEVKEIIKDNPKFRIQCNDQMIVCDKVILTAGGCAYPNLGSNGSGFNLLESLGHHITDVYPSLVGLVVRESTKQLAGIRLKGTVSLEADGKEIGFEYGEVQMRDSGVSGIVMMQMSVIIARRKVLHQQEEYVVKIDLMPSIQKNDIVDILKTRRLNQLHNPISSFFIGMFHPNLGTELFRRINVMDTNQKANTLTDKDMDQLANHIKALGFHFEDFYKFGDAQVSAGGAKLEEFFPETLESKLVENLFCAGEILNVDGESGGFNLQWAWSSGILAGKSAASV
jgi:predicted Rossmann fold flavoprotein